MYLTELPDYLTDYIGVRHAIGPDYRDPKGKIGPYRSSIMLNIGVYSVGGPSGSLYTCPLCGGITKTRFTVSYWLEPFCTESASFVYGCGTQIKINNAQRPTRARISRKCYDGCETNAAMFATEEDII